MFNEDLKRARLRAGLSGRKTAELAGISSAYYSQLETGARGFPPAEVRSKLEEALQTKFAKSLSTAHLQQDTNTDPAMKEQATKPPSSEALELLQCLYALEEDALPMYNKAQKSDDYSAMVVPGLILNLVSLIRRCDFSTSKLGRISTLMHLLNAANSGERSQISVAKSLLDTL